LDPIIGEYEQAVQDLSKDTMVFGDAFKKAKKELAAFVDGEDDFTKRNKELRLELEKLLEGGRSSNEMYKKIEKAQKDWAETVAKKLKPALKDTNGLLSEADELASLLADHFVAFSPEFIKFRDMTRDPLGQSMIESFRIFNRVLENGEITLDQYSAAVRDVVSKQNQFIPPVMGMKEHVGIDAVDIETDLKNEELLYMDSYARKLKAHDEYLQSLRSDQVDAMWEQLDLMEEMESNTTAQTLYFQRQRAQLLRNSEMY